MPQVTVTAAPVKQAGDFAARRINSSDTASLLDNSPGLSTYTGGGASSLPVIHGMNDGQFDIF